MAHVGPARACFALLVASAPDGRGQLKEGVFERFAGYPAPRRLEDEGSQPVDFRCHIGRPIVACETIEHERKGAHWRAETVRRVAIGVPCDKPQVAHERQYGMR
jgi:hypothetical protein